MRVSEYAAMFQAESEHWWYKNLRDEVVYWLGKHLQAEPPKSELKLLDLGCGTGGMLRRLQDQFENVKGFGIDYYAVPLNFAKQVTPRPLLRADAKNLPFRRNSFDAVLCLDVLYTKEVFPVFDAVLEEIRQLLTEGGVLILQVPAFKTLHSQHDVNVHGAHRFTAKEVCDGLQRAGFSRICVYYRYNLLLGAAWIARKFFFRNAGQSQVSVPSPFLNASLYKYSRAESSLNRRASIPFGLSVFAVAYRCFLNMLFDDFWNILNATLSVWCFS
ncbi:MAG: class I SAM-dependent methyltransferase [bacterium]